MSLVTNTLQEYIPQGFTENESVYSFGVFTESVYSFGVFKLFKKVFHITLTEYA